MRRGTERLVDDLGRGMATRGWAPRIVAGHPGRTTRADENGLEIMRIKRRSERVPRIFGYTEMVGHMPGTRRALRARHADIVHSFGAYEAAAASLAGAGRRGRYLTVTGIPRQDVATGLLWRRRALRRALQDSDAVLVLSEAARARLGWLTADLEVLHPGVDLARFARSRERSTEPTLLCTAAADDPRKRVPLVVEAFRILRRRLPEARLVLCGRGASSERWEGITHRDLDRHDDLVAAYSEAWATVLVSTAEAFGLVAVESLACGTPVLAGDDGGIVEAVGGSGPQACVFAGDDPGELAARMYDAIELSRVDGVDAACRAQADRFSIERFLNRHEELYLSRAIDRSA